MENSIPLFRLMLKPWQFLALSVVVMLALLCSALHVGTLEDAAQIKTIETFIQTRIGAKIMERMGTSSRDREHLAALGAELAKLDGVRVKSVQVRGGWWGKRALRVQLEFDEPFAEPVPEEWYLLSRRPVLMDWQVDKETDAVLYWLQIF